jgi:hypothetical protein
MPITATPEDHQVVGEEAQGDLAFLAVGAAGPKGGTEPPPAARVEGEEAADSQTLAPR